jgi:hypothetical protein
MVRKNAPGAIGILIVVDGQPQSGDTQTARHIGWRLCPQILHANMC